MEWFDFGLYNYFVAVIGRVFFPPGSGQLQALGTFAVAFLIRPVGAAFFGPLGDRIGRQRVLAATMLTMSAGTVLIALIPSYDRIGWWAPALLLLARLVQGFSTGGEYGGATVFVGEFSPHRRRGFLGAWLEFGTCAGFLLGAAAAALAATLLPPAALDAWGWRVPFLLAGPLGAVGLYIRLRLEETPAFRHLAEAPAPRPGLRAILRTQRRGLILCVALVVVFNVPDFLVLSYMPAFLTGTVGLAEDRALTLSALVLALMMGLVPLAGRLSDRVGRRPVIGTCCALYVLLALPCFLWVRDGGTAGVLGGLLVLGVILSGLIGTMPATLAALFPTELRYGALAIAYNLSVSLFGATSLPVVAWLVQRTGDRLVPAYYLIGTSVIGLVAVALMRETAGLRLAPAQGTPAEIG